MGQVVLVTGVADDFARRIARDLATSDRVDRVIGVDITPPRGDLGEAQFVRADVRNPVIAKVITRERVDTVIHAMVLDADHAGVGRTALKELNVIGAMQLLAACQQAPDLRRLVVKSHGAVYGSTYRDPAMFTEGMASKTTPSGGFLKDLTEVESYTRGFARRRPDVSVVLLRLANLLGPDVSSPLTDYFRMPVLPTVAGFDPRMQFLHEQDGLNAMTRAALGTGHGTFNITGDGVLTLSQIARRLGRPTAPLPGFAFLQLARTLHQARGTTFDREMVDFLRYGRGLDNSRMREEFGFEPRHTTESAFVDFAASVRPGWLDPARVRRVESAMVDRLAPHAGPSRANVLTPGERTSGATSTEPLSPTRGDSHG